MECHWFAKGLRSNGHHRPPGAIEGRHVAGLRAKGFETSWMSAVRVILSQALAIVIAMAFHLQPVFAIALVISFSLPTAKMMLPPAEEQGLYVQQAVGIITATTVSLLLSGP